MLQYYYDRRTTSDNVRRCKLISSDVIRGYNDTMILAVLIEGDSYGYAISKRIAEISDERYLIKETTLYSAFIRLEKNGFVRSYSGEASMGGRRTYYSITDSGMEYYREKCKEWEVTQYVISKFIRE